MKKKPLRPVSFKTEWRENSLFLLMEFSIPLAKKDCFQQKPK